MGPSDIQNMIRTAATGAGVDGDLACAIAMKESKCLWPKQSSRFEPSYKRFYNPDYFARMNGISIDTETRLQATSHGPMHVLGVVARELGYNDPLELLFTPEIGISYAIKKLKILCDTYESESAVIAAYNAGSPRKINVGPGSGMKYTNQDYVDEVQETLKKFRDNI